MFFLTPRHIKYGRQFVKDARKLLAYKRDLVTPETAADVEREIGHLEVELKTGDKDKIEAQMGRLDAACGKLTKPRPDAAWRENVEVFLVAIVIALAVRTYFIQPFTIPTGSMQPTLNGIIAYETNEPPPNPLARAFYMAVRGRTYLNVTAKEDEAIIGADEVKRFGIFTYTLLKGERNDYLVHAPRDPLLRAFRSLQAGQQFKAGQPIVRGYVETGDHVFVDKISYNFRRPQRGEVFVFNTQTLPTRENVANPGGPSQFYIKRLAGLPNDTLRIDPPTLYINGQRASGFGFERVMSGTLKNPKDGYHGYSNGPEGYSFQLLGSPNSTFTVPEANYFALGDNSYHSSDSRDWGPVPQQNLMGRGFLVYWPFKPHFGLIK